VFDNTITVFAIASDGELVPVACGGECATGASPTSIAVEPAGRFAYVANSDSDTVSMYQITDTGALTPLACVVPNCANTGDAPKALTIDPSGRFVYVVNTGANSVTAFSINAKGVLTPIGAAVPTGNTPVALAIDPFGQYGYVVSSIDKTVTAYRITQSGAKAGALTQVGAPQDADGPLTVTVDPTGQFVYVANETPNTVNRYRIDHVTGELHPLGAVSTRSNPTAIVMGAVGTSPVAVTPKYAYVTNQLDDTVSAFAIDPDTGGLAPVPNSPFQTGGVPEAVAIHPTGTSAYVANRSGVSFNISSFQVDPADGSLVNQNVYQASATAIAVEPSGRFAYTTNDARDEANIYSIDQASGVLTRRTPELDFNNPDVNPFRIVIEPTGRFGYVTPGPTLVPATPGVTAVGGLGSSSLTQGSTFPAGDLPVAGAIHPNGRFAYVANYNSNDVTIFPIDLTSVIGSFKTALGTVAAGLHPNHIAMEPTGRFAYVANYGADSVTAYQIGQAGPSEGMLTPIRGTVADSSFVTGTDPWSLDVEPSGRFLYVVNEGDDTVTIFAISPSDGALSQVGSPVATGNFPHGIAILSLWQ
jgi:6-phosphogluconolactonase (cycloisomerase 2 family)